MKIAIIGAGGVGSAAARFLARDGHDVRLLEQFTLDHDRGSSYGESRIIRRTYPDRHYTGLMNAAYPLWEQLQAEADEELFVRSGGIFFGTTNHPLLHAVADALQAHGTPYETLSAEESRARFPGLWLKRGETAIYQADSGFLRASACVRASVRLARKHGASLRENVKVTGMVPDGDNWRVETEQGDEVVDRVLVTAGAWTGLLLSDLRLPLQPTRQQYIYLRIARNAESFAVGRFPVWIDAGDEHRPIMYGFPAEGHTDGVKFASDARVEPIEPDALNRTVDASYSAALRAYAAERMPDLSGEVTYAHACLYTNTPDHDFIVDSVPGRPGVFLISACSGHGFKFTVLMGRIGADLVAGHSPPFDLSRFSLSRFNSGRPATT